MIDNRASIIARRDEYGALEKKTFRKIRKRELKTVAKN